MNWLTVTDVAKKWNISERSVRNYCAQGRISGVMLVGKTWLIPENAQKPRHIQAVKTPNSILDRLQSEMRQQISGGLYHKTQIELTYNSNHIEGSQLTHDQTRYMFETRTIDSKEAPARILDIIETVNHFACVNYVIEHARVRLTQSLIKQLHAMLKQGTDDGTRHVVIGRYKVTANEVGNIEASLPKDVSKDMSALLKRYNELNTVTLDDILDFHWHFETIHPFQDGNGRVGRLIMFKECLHHHIVPFIIDDAMKIYYYRGLENWPNERVFLRDTCLAAQDKYAAWMQYFGVKD